MAGRDVLLVDRFDRGPADTRRQFVSAMTILGMHELVAARHATYVDLAEHVRTSFTARANTLAALFRRIVVNVLVGNTDDHARNHAAFVDADRYTLTPAYDICPQRRTNFEAYQAMAFGPDENRTASLVACMAAADIYELDHDEAREIVDELLEVVHDHFDSASEAARLTADGRAQLWGSTICSDFALAGYTPAR